MTEVVSRGFGVSPWPSKCCRTTASTAIPWDWTSRDWQSGAFRKLLIPAKVKSSRGFLLTFRPEARCSQARSQWPNLPLRHHHIKEQKEKNEYGFLYRVPMLQTLLWFISFYFFFDVVKVVWCAQYCHTGAEVVLSINYFRSTPKQLWSSHPWTSKSAPFPLFPPLLLWWLCSGHRLSSLGGPPPPSTLPDWDQPHTLSGGEADRGEKDRADKCTLAFPNSHLGKVNYVQVLLLM